MRQIRWERTRILFVFFIKLRATLLETMDGSNFKWYFMSFKNRNNRQKIRAKCVQRLREQTRYACISLTCITLDMIDIGSNNCILHRFRLLSPIANCDNIFQEEGKLKSQIGLAISASYTFVHPKLLSCVHWHLRARVLWLSFNLYNSKPSYENDTMNLILIWNDLRLQWR